MGQSGIAQGLRALLLGAVGQNCWARATICAAEAGSGVAVATGLGVGVGIGVAVGVGMAVGLVVSAPAPAAHPASTQTARTASSALTCRAGMGSLGSQAAPGRRPAVCRCRLVLVSRSICSKSFGSTAFAYLTAGLRVLGPCRERLVGVSRTWAN